MVEAQKNRSHVLMAHKELLFVGGLKHLMAFLAVLLPRHPAGLEGASNV
jgi:hypothetical protein